MLEGGAIVSGRDIITFVPLDCGDGYREPGRELAVAGAQATKMESSTEAGVSSFLIGDLRA
jgi:hypothetical protein